MSDPGALVAAFRRIDATRMAGMSLRNPALSIEAVDFRPVGAGLIGVLITPWTINLVLLPASGTPVPPAGQSVVRQLGQERYAFMGAAEPECGPFEFCSLFSPPEEFSSQAQAREVAAAVIAQLLQAPAALSRRALFVPGAAAR